MSDPNAPGGDEPVRPPSFPEVPAKEHYTGEPDPADQTPPSAERPPPAPRAEPGPPATIPLTPQASTPPTGPPSPPPPIDPGATVPIASGSDAPPPPAFAPVMPAGPPSGQPPFSPAGPPPDPFATSSPGDSGNKNGILIGGLVIVVLAIAGGLALLLTRGGDDEVATVDSTLAPATTAVEAPEPEPEPAPTTTAAPETTTTAAPSTTAPPVTDTIDFDGEFVFLRPVLATVEPGGEEIIVESINASPETFVSTTDDVFAICAGLPVSGAVDAEIVWSLDSTELARIPAQRYEAGSAGGCFIDSVPLGAGTYEVNLVNADFEAVPANITLGFPERLQQFVNDTGADVCRVDLVESTASTFELFEANPPIVPGGTLTIDVADVRHAVRTLGCDESDAPSEEALFDPIDGAINLSTGEAAVPELDAEGFEALSGQIESFEAVLTPEEQAAAVLDIAGRDFFGRIASPDSSATLCSGWFVGNEVQAAVVWEFNQVEIARQVVDSVDGTVGACIEQQGELFRIGSYQVYLAGLGTVTDDAASFTVGREQAEIAFRNDTGVELCEVGFSPTLTNYYSTYLLFDDDGNPDTFAVDSIFTIEAPVAEVDIRTLDCDGNVVTEVLDVPPTDQVVAVSTGQPV
ncbi:MAG: hypothetical protein AB8G26_20415 [Ilumatobacter sp.]